MDPPSPLTVLRTIGSGAVLRCIMNSVRLVSPPRCSILEECFIEEVLTTIHLQGLTTGPKKLNRVVLSGIVLGLSITGRRLRQLASETIVLGLVDLFPHRVPSAWSHGRLRKNTLFRWGVWAPRLSSRACPLTLDSRRVRPVVIASPFLLLLVEAIQN